MKKNIAYYLEDPSRLSEISMNELNSWVEEMPYSQPLRLLVDMKKNESDSVSESTKAYGTYFAEDYEPLSKKAIKKLAKEKIEKVETAKVVMNEVPEAISTVADVESEVDEVKEVTNDVVSPDEAIAFADDVSITNTNVEEIEVDLQELEAVKNKEIDHDMESLTSNDVISEVKEIESVIEELEYSELLKPPLTHTLADDLQEEIIEDDLLETNPNVVLVNEISHEAADEILEEEVERELLEVTLDEVEEVSSFTELDEQSDADIVEEVVTKDEYEGLVDYKSYVKDLYEEEVKSKAPNFGIEEEVTLVEDVVVKEKPKKKTKSRSLKNKAKKNKKKKKSKSKKNTEDKKIESKTKEDKDTEADKSKKKLKVVKSKKDKQKKSQKSKTKKLKSLTGDLSIKSAKSKSIEGKSKKIKKEVKYVVVNEAISNDFKMKDFDGVSNYANWLLEQKSINGNHKLKSKEKIEILAEKKKKNKKKGKKKKSKVLKVAQDSIRKSQMIISEPLANILAAQGHIKKAKKMYTQLGLIFPEKSSYFASKIEKLKKK